MFPNNLNGVAISIREFVMRNETVEEFLKRGGKVTKLKGTVNGFGDTYKTYDAKEIGSKSTVNAFTVRHPELRDWAVKEGIIL
jgi:hypothetical protein